MISMKISLEHMAWSNQKFFDMIAELPEDIYGLRAAEKEWPVGKILTHFINAAEWYRYCLTGAMYGNPEKITSHEILLRSKKYLLELDNSIVAESEKLDSIRHYKDESGDAQELASTILAQAISHTAEHKGQVSTVLAQHGFPCSLDPLDLWTFVRTK